MAYIVSPAYPEFDYRISLMLNPEICVFEGGGGEVTLLLVITLKNESIYNFNC